MAFSDWASKCKNPDTAGVAGRNTDAASTTVPLKCGVGAWQIAVEISN
jgi:hypothetical protein